MLESGDGFDWTPGEKITSGISTVHPKAVGNLFFYKIRLDLVGIAAGAPRALVLFALGQLPSGPGEMCANQKTT